MQNDDTTNAFLIHLSAFIGYLFPFGDIIIPFILWKSQKEKSVFLDTHGKEAVNFNISFAIYRILLIVLLVINFFTALINHTPISFIIGILIFITFEMAKTILIILAATKAKNGEEYNYPFSIKLIK